MCITCPYFLSETAEQAKGWSRTFQKVLLLPFYSLVGLSGALQQVSCLSQRPSLSSVLLTVQILLPSDERPREDSKICQGKYILGTLSWTLRTIKGETNRISDFGDLQKEK